MTRTHGRLPVTLVASLAGLSLVLSGCGKTSNGHGSSVASTPSSTPAGSSGASTPPASQSSGAGDTARLAAITLQPTDVAAGWTATPYKADPADATNQAKLVSCVGGRNTESDKIAEAHSPDYSQANATISSQAASYQSQSDVNDDVAVLKSPKISSCYKTLAQAQISGSLPAGTTIGSLTIKVTPGSGGGPSNVAATATGSIQVTANGQHVAVYINVAFITGPRTEAEVDFDNVGAPVAASIRTDLINKVAARAANG